MSIVKVDAYRCDRCGHTWLPRKGGALPGACPSCHSPYWNAPRQLPAHPKAGTGISRRRRTVDAAGKEN